MSLITMNTHQTLNSGPCAPAGKCIKSGSPNSTTEFRCSINRAGLLTSGIILALIGQTPVSAAEAVNHGSSAGFGISGNLTLTGVPLVDIPATGGSSGTAPPVYANDNGPAGEPLNISAGAGLLNVTGVVISSAASNVDGLPGIRTTSASALINNLNLTVADPPLLPPLVAIGASEMNSQCQVSGNPASSNVTGSTTLTGLTLSISGASVTLPVNPGPNTVIQAAGGVAGITVYLNEQTPVSGSAGEQVAVTALRLKIDSVNVLGIGLVSGEVQLGVSTANQYADADGDGFSNSLDADDDGDGIPDSAEVLHAAANGDTDGDGIPNHRDLDSDNDGINDVLEGGGMDADGDGLQDGAADDNGNGLVDTVDPARGGTVLPLPDTDGDGARDYVDLDSDNDAISDLVESGNGSHDTDNDGAAEGADEDGDGIVGGLDGSAVFGDANSPALPDADGDGSPNHRDTSSNGSGSRDISGSGHANSDSNNDGIVDDTTDADKDGVADVIDADDDAFGGLGDPSHDEDDDGATDIEEGSGLVDTDGDGIPDSSDSDSDGDGIPDLTEVANAPSSSFDTDGDGVVDRRDLDSDNDGINDVIEGGGVDTDGDGLQDGSTDADQDGLVDTADITQGGVSLPVPDSDADGARDYVDLDSDNDTVSDLLEGGSGAPDTNFDGIVDGGDADGDGIRDEVDRLTTFGDAQDPGAVNTDGADLPDYIDTDSDNAGSKDIELAGNSSKDTDNDGRVDGPYADPDADGVHVSVDTRPNEFGGTGGCAASGSQWKNSHFNAAELLDPAISGWDADPDSDGMSNALEYAFGTNPRVISPQPMILSSITLGGGSGVMLTVTRDACSRAFLNAEYSTDLTNWISSGPEIEYLEDSESSLIVSISGSQIGEEDRLFVRLKVTVP